MIQTRSPPRLFDPFDPFDSLLVLIDCSLFEGHLSNGIACLQTSIASQSVYQTSLSNSSTSNHADSMHRFASKNRFLLKTCYHFSLQGTITREKQPNFALRFVSPKPPKSSSSYSNSRRSTMCRFVKHAHTACEHADQDGRQGHRELGFIRYCDRARILSQINKEKTKLCSGMKVEDLPVDLEYLQGMCRRCCEAKGGPRIHGAGLTLGNGNDPDQDVASWGQSVVNALKWIGNLIK